MIAPEVPPKETAITFIFHPGGAGQEWLELSGSKRKGSVGLQRMFTRVCRNARQVYVKTETTRILLQQRCVQSLHPLSLKRRSHVYKHNMRLYCVRTPLAVLKLRCQQSTYTTHKRRATLALCMVFCTTCPLAFPLHQTHEKTKNNVHIGTPRCRTPPVDHPPKTTYRHEAKGHTHLSELVSRTNTPKM